MYLNSNNIGIPIYLNHFKTTILIVHNFRVAYLIKWKKFGKKIVRKGQKF